MLEGEQERAERETWLRLHDNEDGTVSARCPIPELHAELLRVVLVRLSGATAVEAEEGGPVAGRFTCRPG
jgi:hypothetical protein